MKEKAHPIEISIWDIPSVRYEGEIYRVFNSDSMELRGDYVITDIDSEDYVDVIEEIHWDALYIRGVSDILSIEGLSSLTFLKRLELFKGTINEIKGIESLVNLEELDLSFNQIASTFGLQTLVNLKKLYLNDNQITEVRNLASLRTLKVLYLNNNHISELNALELPVGLEILSVKGNNISDVKNLNQLKDLKSIIQDP